MDPCSNRTDDISTEKQDTSDVQISVLIPVCGQWSFTQTCLKSLWRYWPEHLTGECIIHDDASPDESSEELKKWQPPHSRLEIQILHGPGGTNYAQANNRMAKSAQGQTLVMLNNDTVLFDNWLEPMLRVLNEKIAAGVVGNQQLYPNSNRIHHAGGCFAKDGLPTHLYDGWPATTPGVHRTRPVQFVTAACWATQRHLFESINGFDESYHFGYEDIDYCLRALTKGFGVWYCGKSVIEHHGGGTPGRYAKDHKNHDIFIRRWGKPSSKQYRLDASALAAEDGNQFPNWPFTLRAARRLKKIPVTRKALASMSRYAPIQRIRKLLHKKSIQARK